MNLQSLFQDFNPSKFLVYVCLLLFTILFCLRLDGVITWSYWAVFLPLWIWKFMVIAGACIGSYVWWRHPQYRVEGEGYIHYKAMLISVVLQVLLLMFEVLVCDKLENNRHWWILVFVPLIFISIISVVVCIWAVKHDRSFELELFCSVNILQFIFLALRLDEIIMWNWVVVFVPLWIVMCMAVIGVLYAIIFASILLRTPEVSVEQRRTSMHSAISYSVIVIPLLIYLVLLSNKLDSESSLTYVATCIPLYFTFIVLILLAFGSKGGNHWWFGIRKDFCQFLLSVCPLLQEYGNISYSLHSNEPEDTEPSIQVITCAQAQEIPHGKERKIRLSLATTLSTLHLTVCFTPNFDGEHPGRTGPSISHPAFPTTSLSRGLLPPIFGVPPCSTDSIHLQTFMSSPGFEPRPFGPR